MLPLPILNLRLNACHEDLQRMTPVTQGHHCSHCDRVVIDFTESTQADLEAAFQASADGRVCGRFRQSQLASKPQLRPKLRRFLVALMLVCGLGLTSTEAWAQVQKAMYASNCTSNTELMLKTPEELNPAFLNDANEPLLAPIGAIPEKVWMGMVVEIMPSYKNGGSEGLMKFVQKNVHWPVGSERVDVEGKVFISFVVDKNGRVRDAKVLKGIYPILDAEALRVVQLLDGQFEPGKQNQRSVDVSFTIPITFRRD